MTASHGSLAVEKSRAGGVFLALVAAVAIAAPVLNQLVPASSSLHLSTYSLTLIGKYLPVRVTRSGPNSLVGETATVV